MLKKTRSSLRGHPGHLGQSGQAAVESAIILPLMVFMLLGIVQLTMMHQARLMVEYAAFNACRAGIVYNMDKGYMTRAALISLMPTFQATDTLAGTNDSILGHQYDAPGSSGHRPGIAQTWAKMRLLTAGSAMLSKLFENLGGQGGQLDFIKVTVLNPKREMFGDQPELHFDDFLLDDQFRSRNKDLRKATRLTVRVRYLYWMRIPFANWIIHMAWLAGEAGVTLTGPIDRPAVALGVGPFGTKIEGAARSLYISGKVKDNSKPFDEEDRTTLFRGLWALGRVAHMYFIPMYGTYSMRMQSNPFVDNTDM
ncbi:MAG TPA: pilus assembly protein [Myxococcota bacterium]|nr:pilus assembly protein [Myxococcota bacterium]HRY94470.1 pilus assembly protein [Myxococcota bacterium]